MVPINPAATKEHRIRLNDTEIEMITTALDNHQWEQTNSQTYYARNLSYRLKTLGGSRIRAKK